MAAIIIQKWYKVSVGSWFPLEQGREVRSLETVWNLGYILIVHTAFPPPAGQTSLQHISSCPPRKETLTSRATWRLMMYRLVHRSLVTHACFCYCASPECPIILRNPMWLWKLNKVAELSCDGTRLPCHSLIFRIQRISCEWYCKGAVELCK